MIFLCFIILTCFQISTILNEDETKETTQGWFGAQKG